jgi:hypothetical protein
LSKGRPEPVEGLQQIRRLAPTKPARPAARYRRAARAGPVWRAESPQRAPPHADLERWTGSVNRWTLKYSSCNNARRVNLRTASCKAPGVKVRLSIKIIRINRKGSAYILHTRYLFWTKPKSFFNYYINIFNPRNNTNLQIFIKYSNF